MADSPHEHAEERHGSTRRDFLKKSAVAGAVTWSAPAITALSSGKAWAQADGYEKCPCFAEATALFVSLLGKTVVNVTPETLDDECVAKVDTGSSILDGGLRVEARVLCANEEEPDNGPCVASASVAEVAIHIGPALLEELGDLVDRLLEELELDDVLNGLLGDNGKKKAGLTIRATVLTAEATASCDKCPTRGESSIATLSINGKKPDIDLRACNASVLGLLTVNEQECKGDTITVRALHIDLGDVLEVIVSEAQAGGNDCPCETC